MITIAQMIESADIEAAFDIVDMAAERGNVDELVEAQRALLAKLRKRHEIRKQQLQEMMLDRHLKGAIVKLSEHSHIPLKELVSISLNTK